MTTVTHTKLDQIVKEAGHRFLHQPTCIANKRNMLELVERLEEYTDEVAEKADEYGMTTDANVAQWNRDYNNWLLRISRYRHALEAAKFESGNDSCEELRVPVNEPLLVGWYPAGTPGIQNTDQQTIADVATPFILGNQVLVYQEHQQWRLERLLKDLTLWDEEARQGAVDYWGEKTGLCGAAGCKGPCDTPCWLRRIGAGVGVIVGGYVIYRGVKWAFDARSRAVQSVIGVDPQPADEPLPESATSE